MTGLRRKPLRGHRDDLPYQAALKNKAEVHTSLQAEIVDFDPEKQEATVKILHKPMINGKEKPFPELKKVPVVFPRGGGYGLTWPIGEGDPGRITVAERDISKWYSDGGEQTGDSSRMHDLSDAIFEPGGMRSEPQKVPGFNNQRTELRALNDEANPKIEMGGDLLFMRLDDMEIKMEQGGTVTIKCDKFVLDSPDINLGGEGGEQVHRIGDVDDASNLAVTGASRVKAI